MDEVRRCGHSALRWNTETQSLDKFEKYPIYLGEDGTEQFSVTTRANGEVIGDQKIHDPFIRTTVKLRGWKWAWKALFGGISVQVSVDGTEGASRAVMTLNPHSLSAETAEIMESRRLSREANMQANSATLAENFVYDEKLGLPKRKHQ